MPCQERKEHSRERAACLWTQQDDSHDIMPSQWNRKLKNEHELGSFLVGRIREKILPFSPKKGAETDQKVVKSRGKGRGAPGLVYQTESKLLLIKRSVKQRSIAQSG